MDIDKRIDSVINRFDDRIYSDQDDTIGGNHAFEEIVSFLNYCPQNIAMLERLFPALTKECPLGTKRTLKLIADTNLYSPAPDNVYFVGDEEYAGGDWLVIDLTLPESATDEDINTVATFVETFSHSQGDFGGVIAVEIN